MSILVRVTVPADVATFRAFFASHADEMVAVAQRAKGMGCTSHRFAVGDGEVVVTDIWESREAFEAFFSDPEIGQIMAQSGASGPPVFQFNDIVDTADSY